MQETILITGGSGKLGKVLIKELNGGKILHPSREQLDITNQESVKNYFRSHNVDIIIHCAAIASVGICEKDPHLAVLTNSNGTSNLVKESIGKNIRFFYISTDYVYPCAKGNYKESDNVEPFTVYGWTKLAGEDIVRILPNHAIVRTSFFQPDNIPFDTAFTDSFCSKIPIEELAKSIILILNKGFKGVINIGQKRISLYDLYKKYKPSIKPGSRLDAGQTKRAKDSSMDVSLWDKIKQSP